MKPKKYNLIREIGLVACILLVSGCAEEEATRWQLSDADYVEFDSNADYSYSFAGQPATVDECALSIPLKIVGASRNEPRTVSVRVSRAPHDADVLLSYTSAVQVAAGATSVDMEFRLRRTPGLALEADTLEFEVEESEWFRLGEPDMCRKRVIVSDRFVAPSWWGGEYDPYYNPVGAPNNAKLKLWWEIFGNFDDPREGSRAWTGNRAVISLSIANAKALEVYGKEFHLIEDTDEKIA